MYQGWDIKIDQVKNRYKKLYRVLGIPMSDGWIKLPEIKYVALTKLDMIKTNRSVNTIGNESSHKVERFAVFMYGSKKNIRIEICKKKSLKTARKIREEVSNYLKTELIDYTFKE